MPKANKEKMGNPGWWIVTAILIAIGVFVGVQGFVLQLQLQGGWDSTTAGWIIGYYFIGILFVGAAKMLKWKMGWHKE